MIIEPRGAKSSLDTYLMCLGHYQFKPSIYMNCMEKFKFIQTNGMLDIELMYLY